MTSILLTLNQIVPIINNSGTTIVLSAEQVNQIKRENPVTPSQPDNPPVATNKIPTTVDGMPVQKMRPSSVDPQRSELGDLMSGIVYAIPIVAPTSGLLAGRYPGLMSVFNAYNNHYMAACVTDFSQPIIWIGSETIRYIPGCVLLVKVASQGGRQPNTKQLAVQSALKCYIVNE